MDYISLSVIRPPYIIDHIDICNNLLYAEGICSALQVIKLCRSNVEIMSPLLDEPSFKDFVVRFCYHRTIPMMRFAAYYGFTIDCNCNIAAYNLVIVGRNLPETCSGLNLARGLGTAGLNLRPVSMPP
jgi:hypothetical protein